MTICDICGRHIEKIKKTQRIFVRKDPEGNSRLIEAGGYDLPFHCNYCGGTFCTDHRLPENHNCSYHFTAERIKQISSPITSYEAASILRDARNMDECLKDKIKQLNKQVDGIHDHDGASVIHDDDGQLWIHGRRHSRVEVIEDEETIYKASFRKDPVIPRRAQEKLDYMKDFEYLGEGSGVQDKIKEKEHDRVYAANVPKATIVWKIILLVGLGLIGVFYILYPSQFHEFFDELVQFFKSFL